MMLIMQMEKIIRNPGLQHLAEEVFWNLNVEDLKVCAQINQSANKFCKIRGVGRGEASEARASPEIRAVTIEKF